MLGDAEVIQQIRQGNRQAYGLLIERYERIVQATAMRVTRDRHAALDVVQDAFIAALEQLGSLRNPEKFGAWLLMIVKRTAAKAAAKRRRTPTLVGDPDQIANDPNDALSDRSQHLLELLDRLPEHEQTVVALRYLNGYSAAEVADICGRPVGTVNKQLSRAYERLRNWLQEGE